MANMFSSIRQTELNNLASILPMTLKIIRDPGRSTAILPNMSESDQRLIESLSEAQFRELLEIQELFASAQRTESYSEKLALYDRCFSRAPWHYLAAKSLGVCYHMNGEIAKAHGYLKESLGMAPNDAEVLKNLLIVDETLRQQGS